MRSGVICSPNNYLYEDEDFPEGFIRVTLMADHDRWCALPEEEYRLAKLRWYDETAASSVRFMPDYRRRVVDTDMFTPRTIHRFTWHDNGAVYGAPEKQLDGTTSIEHLFLCGSDQGFVGIVGSDLERHYWSPISTCSARFLSLLQFPARAGFPVRLAARGLPSPPGSFRWHSLFTPLQPIPSRSIAVHN